MGTYRLAQFLARCGVASRRKSEELILAGRVCVNSVVATDLGRQVNSDVDEVLVDGAVVGLASQHLTLALHKPPRVMTTRSDPQQRRTVYDLLPPAYQQRSSELVYAGRLDFMTSGLLILSTDGRLIYHLTHPRHHVEKEYQMELNRTLSPIDRARLLRGVKLQDGHAQAASLERVPGPRPVYRMVLMEGRNRQVRRMVEEVGATVTSLARIRYGGLTLATLALQEGEWCELTDEQQYLLHPGKDNTPTS